MLYDRKLYGQVMLEHIIDFLSFWGISIWHITLSSIFPNQYLFDLHTCPRSLSALPAASSITVSHLNTASSLFFVIRPPLLSPEQTGSFLPNSSKWSSYHALVTIPAVLPILLGINSKGLSRLRKSRPAMSSPASHLPTDCSGALRSAVLQSAAFPSTSGHSTNFFFTTWINLSLLFTWLASSYTLDVAFLQRGLSWLPCFK